MKQVTYLTVILCLCFFSSVLFLNFTLTIPVQLNGMIFCGERCIDLSSLIIEESSTSDKSIYAQQNSKRLARALNYALSNSIEEIRLPENKLVDYNGRIIGKFYIGTSLPINDSAPTQVRLTNYSGNQLRIVSNNALLYFFKGDIEIRNIQFENISLRFAPKEKTDISRIYIEKTSIADGFNGEYSYIPGSSSIGSTIASNDHQISMINVKGAMIYSASFSRSQNELGRGISLFASQEIKIIRNTCKGYYVTCLNVGGSTKQNDVFPDNLRGFNIEILKNTFIRYNGGEAAIPTIGQEPDRKIVNEDHGIYIWGAKNISVLDNNIQGWGRTSSGNSIKLRDSEFVSIRNNIFKTSGIIMYVSSCLPNLSCYLRNVAVTDNHFLEKPDDSRSIIPDFSELNQINSSKYTTFYFYKNTRSDVPTPENQIQNISITGNIYTETYSDRPIIIYNSFNHNNCSSITINTVPGKNSTGVCLF